MDNKTALLYSKMPEHKYLVNKTNRFVEWSLKQVSQPYVACSFGKDSSVMLHIVTRLRPDIPVRFATHPETHILDDYHRVIEWWQNNHSINLQDVHCEGGAVKIKHHQRRMLEQGNWDSFFVGIRKEESVARRIYLSTYGKFYKLKFNDLVKICPMSDWKQKDVAAYIAMYDIPLLDKYQFGGIGQRTSSGIARTHIEDTITSLKQRDLQRYNKLIELYPDLAYYA